VKIGILGAAGIAPNAIIWPARRRGDVTVLAVAARDEARAADYAKQHGIPVWYGDYRRLLDDPEIDLVYNALPPSGHAQWSIAALDAGKDVLCEKPFALNAEQAAAMAQAADRTGRRLVEAFHDRYHPLWPAVSEILGSGRLGRIRTMDAVFTAEIPSFADSLRHVPELGGGSLMDLGCYAVHWLRSFTGEEPAVTSASAELGPFGADDAITAQLDFPSGIQGRVESSFTRPLTQTLRVTAEGGTLDVSGLVFPARGHTIREVTCGLPRTSTVGGQDTYDHQLAAVLDALRSGAPLPTEGEDPVANMAAIDAIYAAAGVPRPAG
jgi:predicted dehydrogenase